MVDFLKIATRRKPKEGIIEVYPTFRLYPKSTDLMIRGGDFYAIWLEEKGLWSTEEQDALKLIDNELDIFAEEKKTKTDDNVIVLHMWDASTGMIDIWHKFCQKQSRDNFHMLDEKLIFSNMETKKDDYASKVLPYPLAKGDISAYDTLISVLYSPEERKKIEWAIGAIVCGDSKTIQKFLVLYGAAGTGKSTILNIIQDLFQGYYSVFDAKALGSASNSFALEAFKTNPLVAIQHDGDLSRIEDNTRLNSLVSHELMTVNEKFKSTYANQFKSFLFMGTNRPVKITDAKSGILRRLIDVSPTGKKVTQAEYRRLTKEIKFELGAIAYHCQEVYKADPDAYDSYIPTEMLGASNDFYNFIIESYFVFKNNELITLKAAWEMYVQYCNDAKVGFPYSKRQFKEELKNYFWKFDERGYDENGDRVRNVYSGFRADKVDGMDDAVEKVKADDSGLINFDCTESIFDKEYADCPAQYAGDGDIPTKKWDNVKTKLSDIDTSKVHYVKIPENHIVIDFDIPDEDGNKNFELNLAEASAWPRTYAELSKSGQGIHLHYIYEGDVSKLNRIYDDHVEIKIFTGKSSLRRKLTKCNNSPIAKINAGLPLKGDKKVVNFEAIKSEKLLRNMIMKNLRKEIHGNTTQSVSFILKLLDDAYNAGTKYDVSDLRSNIFAFAASSTHQADKCIKMVGQMKFKSEDNDISVPLDGPPVVMDTSVEKPIAFFDIEIFPNLFLVNYKEAGLGKTIRRLINPRQIDIEEMVENYRLIAFNNRRYDNHIIYGALIGYSVEQLYRLSQKIINSKKGEKNNAFFGEAYNLSYTDIYDFASAGNKKSLKKLEIEMNKISREELKDKGFSESEIDIIKAGSNHKELGLPWDHPVPEDKWIKVSEYCDNDVLAAEAAFTYLKADWTARCILADLAGATVNDTTNSLTTKVIFDKNKEPQNEFNYRDLAQPVKKIPADMRSFLEMACPEMMAAPHRGYDNGEESILPYFPGYKYAGGISTYRGDEVGEGGYVYAEEGMYINVALLDVSSMHPHSTIAEVLFGVKYTTAYRDIVEGRVDIKHEAWNEVDNMLNGKLRPYIQKVKNGEMSSGDLANALKTAINSVYGLTSANFSNPFRDIRNKDNIVAKRGALFMIDLKNMVQNEGYTVAHIKTDSIKIPNATPEIIDKVMKFGKRYGYTFEHEATYDRMCLVNNAVYIARYKSAEDCEKLYGYSPKENKKHGMQWTATGTQFQVPYVFKKLFSKEPIEFNDLCETKSVTSALYLDMNEKLKDISKEEAELDKLSEKFRKGTLSDTTYEFEKQRLEPIIAEGHNYIFVGKVSEFCPIKPGFGGGLLMRLQNDKYYSATGATGYRWLESEDVKLMYPDWKKVIDISYYQNMANEAVDAISKYCDFERFTDDAPFPFEYEIHVPVTEEDSVPFDEN